MNIIVLGAGIFGTAIANELAVNKKNSVILFCRRKEQADEINSKKTNKSYFPNKYLSDNLKATIDPKKISSVDVILIALPSNVIKDEIFFIKPFLKKKTLLVTEV